MSQVDKDSLVQSVAEWLSRFSVGEPLGPLCKVQSLLDELECEKSFYNEAGVELPWRCMVFWNNPWPLAVESSVQTYLASHKRFFG